MIWLPVALTVFTAVEDVQACLPLPGGEVAAGTQGGLVLVGEDGGMKGVWTALDGLPGTRIGAVIDGGDGGERGIWVGGEAGLARVKLGGGKLAIEESHELKPVRAILLRAGRPLVATWGGGVVEIVANEPKVVAAAGAQVTSIAVAGGVLWAGTTAGLVRGDGHADAAGLPSSMVWSLAVVGGDKLWAGTLAGLTAIDHETGKAHVEGHADTRALLGGDALVVGTYGEGVLGEPDLSSIHVNGIARAHGATCVAAREGLYVRRDGGAWQKARLTGLPDNDVSALAFAKGAIWVGTFDHGLVFRGPGDKDWTAVPGVDLRINALAVDSTGIWAGTARGLVMISFTGQVLGKWGASEGLPSEEVHTLAPIAGGMAVGTTKGLALVDMTGKAAQRVTPIEERQGLPSAGVWAVAEAKPGVLWVGTGRGVVRLEKGHVYRYSMATAHLDEDWVTALLVENGGNDVWVGTYSKGVTRLHKHGKHWIATHFGGGAVNVGGLARDGKWLYVATMGGLLRREVSAAAETPWTPVARSAAGADVTAVIPAADAIWVGSRRGVVSMPR